MESRERRRRRKRKRIEAYSFQLEKAVKRKLKLKSLERHCEVAACLAHRHLSTQDACSSHRASSCQAHPFPRIFASAPPAMLFSGVHGSCSSLVSVGGFAAALPLRSAGPGQVAASNQDRTSNVPCTRYPRVWVLVPRVVVCRLIARLRAPGASSM